jgi:hypothetical protein
MIIRKTTEISNKINKEKNSNKFKFKIYKKSLTHTIKNNKIFTLRFESKIISLIIVPKNKIKSKKFLQKNKFFTKN